MTMTMADIGDARVAEQILGFYLRGQDRPEVMIAHPALRKLGSVNAASSDTLVVPIWTWGGDEFASRTEIQATSITDIAPTQATVTVARLSLAHGLSDLVRMTEGQGALTPESIAMTLLMSADRTKIKRIAALSTGFSGSGGTSGSAATIQGFIAAVNKVGLSVDGRKLALLHPQQLKEIVEDAAATQPGMIPVGFQAGDLATRPLGYQFSLPSLGVDIFTSATVPTSGGDYVGMICGPDAIGWADGIPPVDDPTDQVLIGDLLIERHRTASEARTDWYGHLWFGVTEIKDSRGIKFLSDVPA